MSTNPSQLTEQTPQKVSIKAPLMWLALMFVATVGLIIWTGYRARFTNPIFRQTKNGWEQVPSPAGAPETVRISAKGAVWVLTWSHTGLRRWDGDRWRSVKFSDTKTGYINGNFALDGEDVWTPTDRGVQHWDGQRWHSYSEVIPGEGASTVAGDGQVWMVDHSGKLFHFEKGKWSSQKLVLPGMSAAQSQEDEWPQLARTVDGTVWLVLHRVWRLNGDFRIPVISDGKLLDNVTLLGAAGDRLWLMETSGIRAVSPDGSSQRYTPAQTGIPDAGALYDVASDGRLTWFATGKGLVEFDGSHWRQIPRPSERVPDTHAIAAAPDGTLWAIGFTPGGSFRNRYLIYLNFLPGLGMLGGWIWLLQRVRRRQLQQHQRVAQAVQHATGQVPLELEIGERQLASSGWIWAIYIFGGSLAFYFLRKIWPQMPYWMIPVLVIAVHIVITFQQSLVKRKPQAWDPIGPGAPSQYDWGKTLKSVGGAVFFILILNADRFPALRLLRGYMFWAALAGVIGYKALGIKLMNQALRRADYDGALKVIRVFHFYNPSGSEALRMSGHILLLAGRYREAEDALRRSFTSSHAAATYGMALEYLGDTLMEEGRYDEAQRSFEAALHTFTWLRRPYRGMAEMLLRQGQDPQKALQYVESIVDFAGLSQLQIKNNGRPQDDYWSLKAWALACTGRSSEVAGAIESALKATSSKCLPDLAATHYRAGMAMQALGNGSEAKEHFRRAVEYDPQGRRGRLAGTAVHDAGVWRTPATEPQALVRG
ncbi:MAG TPA: tetratricopeptide repeat protein [Bryobacteraceae bacterium]|nr:tetratricopeptide repeat protein [Bryobacteraceae bacterium]